MNLYKTLCILLITGISLHVINALGATPVEQWRQGLSCAQLTAYEGSVINSNSTLTVVSLCVNGRYWYNKEGSWSVPGTAGGASNSTITGHWDIRQNGPMVLLVYSADDGEKGAFPINLQNDGRVNIGGTAFAVEQGAAGR